jgi:hypothetical protein
MSRLQELHPDQQAVLQLVLRRRMAYADIGATLGLEASQVRERALDAVDGLAPDDVEYLALEDRDRIADLLLGQGSDDERDATRALLRDHSPARTWADRVAAELDPLGGPAEALPARDAAPGAHATDSDVGSDATGSGAATATHPDVPPAGAADQQDGPAHVDDAHADAAHADASPAGDADADARAAGAAAAAAPVAAGGSGDVRQAFAALDAGAAPKAGRERTPRTRGSRPSSRALAAGVLALVVAALVIAWVGGVFNGRDDEDASTANAAAPAQTTTQASAAQDDARAFLATLPRQINFTAPVGAQAPFAGVKGVAQSTLSQTTGEPVLALTTEGMPKASKTRRYFAWADKSGSDPILIGQLTDARGAELPFVGVDLKTRQPANVDPTVYNRIRITRQGAAAPTKPGPTVLVGTLRLRSAS